MVEITPNVREILAPMMAVLYKNSPVTLPSRRFDPYRKMTEFLCRGISGYCRWNSNSRTLEKSLLRYFESCNETDGESGLFCRIVNLHYLELYHNANNRNALLALLKDNSTLDRFMAENEVRNVSDCREEAIRRTWLQG